MNRLKPRPKSLKRSSIQKGRRLRKQPKLRRVYAVGKTAFPHVAMPKTAAQRRKRNSQRLQMPAASLRQIVTSARWISLSVLAVCLAALVVIGQDPGFYLNAIPVEGAKSIDPAEIIEVSGLDHIHIFAADPTAAAARIGELPGIITATVIIEWPNSATIRIGENPPVAVWKQAGAQYWIDRDGQLISSETKTVGLLVIESEVADAVGEGFFVPKEALSGALRLRELRPNIESLYYRPGSGLSYQDGRGWRAFFGVGPDMTQKLAVYETVVADLVERGITPAYVSVANKSKPYYMVAGSQ